MLTQQQTSYDQNVISNRSSYGSEMPGVVQDFNKEIGSDKPKLTLDVINMPDLVSNQHKEAVAEQQQNNSGSESAGLKTEKRSSGFKVQQLSLCQSQSQSQEFFSFSDHEAPTEVGNDEVKNEPENEKNANDKEFETCNHDDPSSDDDIDDECQNRINEVIMLPNITKHIISKAHMELKEMEARNLPNTYNTMPKEFKNPFSLTFKKENIAPLPRLEGYLKKRTMNVIPTWQSRYFVLENRKLFYYKTKERSLISGCLDLDLLSINIELTKSETTFKIIPDKSKRDFVLKAENKEEAKKWIEAIQEHRKVSEGCRNNVSIGTGINRFWKHDRISPSDFLDQADTGDLLLFKTKHPNAKLQRSFTGSSYDHVAILLKYQTGEIVLFEAASKNGVSLCRWKTFLLNDWKKLYSRIMFRKLNMRRKEDIITLIEDFVKSTVGKKYKVNLTKLWKKKVAVGEEEKAKDRTFFCSELVAAFYKKINLLPSDTASCGFLPGSFSSEKKIQLLNDAKLEHEKLIDFTLDPETNYNI